MKACAKCGEKGTADCGKCGAVSYCGRDCQVADWKAHKAHCKWVLRRRDAPGAQLTAHFGDFRADDADPWPGAQGAGPAIPASLPDLMDFLQTTVTATIDAEGIDVTRKCRDGKRDMRRALLDGARQAREAAEAIRGLLGERRKRLEAEKATGEAKEEGKEGKEEEEEKAKDAAREARRLEKENLAVRNAAVIATLEVCTELQGAYAEHGDDLETIAEYLVLPLLIIGRELCSADTAAGAAEEGRAMYKSLVDADRVGPPTWLRHATSGNPGSIPAEPSEALLYKAAECHYAAIKSERAAPGATERAIAFFRCYFSIRGPRWLYSTPCIEKRFTMGGEGGKEEGGGAKDGAQGAAAAKGPDVRPDPRVAAGPDPSPPPRIDPMAISVGEMEADTGAKGLEEMITSAISRGEGESEQGKSLLAHDIHESTHVIARLFISELCAARATADDIAEIGRVAKEYDELVREDGPLHGTGWDVLAAEKILERARRKHELMAESRGGVASAGGGDVVH
eukprot:TRINITY_DN3149_c0_g1_i1.p1 TRINITY_DN3149_c0_g1~~TRINITY_DN3149_c0_g1_i1.p1  ORF type:complete len:541 (+),score=230.11 TRINITY_DN3149_c0_g1_i1:91-1623(+)